MYDRISDIKLKRTDTTLDLSQKAVDGVIVSDILTVWDGKTYQRELRRKEEEERTEGAGLFVWSNGASATGSGHF